ncbi:MAG TPA: helix-turn-helix domain-containing protein, partial [Gemmatimonadales bacterium]|nr:helix-turn-helix domain-containing protein [Gemmatimonadales bacterium]
PDPSRRGDFARALHDIERSMVVVGSAEAAAEALSGDVDMMLLDLSLPDLDLPALRRALSSTLQEPDSLDAAERRHLALVLRHTAGNKRKAAHILGISRSTLLNKVRKYRLEAGR